MKNYRMKYNDAQIEAIEHKDGPMMVLAGPGSGKTSVITGRTCRLLEQGVSPYSILVVTFTRAAAAEMRERFLRVTEENGRGVTFGTFHGIFYGILKNTFHLTGNNILGKEETDDLLKEIIHSCYKGGEREADLPSAVSREISMVKESRLSLKHFYSSTLPEETFRKVFVRYENWKKENQKLDFDDIIFHCHRLLRMRPDILGRWQNRFQYILIDEFQDISPMQYEVIKMLAKPRNNIFIVGDDDQSIYRFRGANPGIMLNFPKDYPDTQKVVLRLNYRSTPEIVSSAQNVISHNQKRFPKDISAVRKTGKKVEHLIFNDQRSEAKFLCRSVREEFSAGTPYENIAVLVRTNSGGRAAIEQMLSEQIPFHAVDVIPCIYDHWIARQIMAYLDIAAGSTKRSDFLQIYNRPNRYISRAALSDPEITLDLLYDYYEGKDWMCDRIYRLETDLRAIGRLSPFGAVTYIRHEVGYEKYVREYAAQMNLSAEDLIAVLDELCDSARDCRTLDQWKEKIGRYRETIKKQRQREEKEAGVTVETIHASKGMEYESVYILDVNEGILPYKKAVLEADLEEERRMFYVGMTRAKDRLRLFSIRERYEKKLAFSRFLREM